MLKNLLQILLRIQKTLKLFLKPFIKVSNQEALRLELFIVFVPFRPIMSAIKTPTYNLAKFLVPLLEPITTNIYTVKNSFEYAKEIAD